MSLKPIPGGCRTVTQYLMECLMARGVGRRRNGLVMICRRLFAMLLLPVAGLVAQASAAELPTPLINLATEKCLDVAGASVVNGGAVNQFGCHGGTNQQWWLQPEATAPGFYSIRNQGSGRCVDDPAVAASPVRMQQYECHHGANQLFRMQPFDDPIGGMRMVSQRSGLCLAVADGAGDGAPVVEQPCDGRARQRWLHAAPLMARHAVPASTIAGHTFSLLAGHRYTFHLEGFLTNTLPCLHLWRASAGDVAFKNGLSTGNTVEIGYTVPSGQSGSYTLFVFAFQGRPVGSATLTFRHQGLLPVTLAVPRFGGTTIDVAGSPAPRAYVYQTALLAGGADDTLLLALDATGAIRAVDDNGGVGNASRIAGVGSVARLVVGVPSGAREGPAFAFANDVLQDADGDGLGRELERTLGTCDNHVDHPRCAFVADLRDSDRDGLDDADEVFGIDGPAPQLLSAWGASPVHKDAFIEVDYALLDGAGHPIDPPHTPGVTITEADAEAIRGYLQAGKLSDIRNPDGQIGIAIHLDLGFAPTQGRNLTLFGNWGGSSTIPHWAREHLTPARQSRFFHAVAATGGQGNADFKDSWGFSMLDSSDPRARVRTFVHEMGHVFNLAHEGGTDAHKLGVNCAVTYPSIMSYAGENPGGPWGVVGFDEGRFAGVELNPSSLCEAEGMRGQDARVLSGYGLMVDANGGVDWNRDLQIDSCARRVRARLNWTSAVLGCDTHIQGRFGKEAEVLARGGSPSLAFMSERLYLFFIDSQGRMQYREGVQGPRFAATDGCPTGMHGGEAPDTRCTDWQPPMSTPESGPVTSVRAFAVAGSMVVAFTRPGSTQIQLLIASTVASDGRLGGWSQQSIAASRSQQAPALGLMQAHGPAGDQRLLAAIWTDSVSGQLDAAHADPAALSRGFVRRTAAPRSELLNPITSNGTPVTLASWGTDSVPTAGQTWMATASASSMLQLLLYDPQRDVWRNRTASVFPKAPENAITERIGFAYRPLLDASGIPLHPLKGEFTLVFVANSKVDSRGRISISDVVSADKPPDSSLFFPSILSTQFGHDNYGVSGSPQGGFELFAAPGFPFLRGAVVRPDADPAQRIISFLAYADGIFDMRLQTASDFQVMERGICLRLRAGNSARCGPENVFGF